MSIQIRTTGGSSAVAPSGMNAIWLKGGSGCILLYQASSLPPIGTPLANFSWAQISAIARAGEAADYWSVGDTKSVTLGSGTNAMNYTFCIIGINHDVLSDSAAYGRANAGITFQMQDCYSDYFTHSVAMNSSTYTALLPAELSSVIVPVNKQSSSTGASGAATTTTSSSVFLLSEVEAAGTNTCSRAGEGTQYSYYANGGSLQKVETGYPDLYVGWHLRSLYKTYVSFFTYVDTTGKVCKASSTPEYTYSSFAFCV